MGTNLWQALKAFNLLRLLENETIEMFSIEERSQSKHKFGGTRICSYENREVREYFMNPKLENEVFGYCIN